MKRMRTTLTLAALLPGVLLLPLAPARAGGTPPGALTPSEANLRTSDVFLGRNTTGPYALAWKGIRSDNVAVLVDGTPLSPEAFTVDTDKGAITFKSALKPQSVARVDYGYEPGRAQRNVNPASAPVTVSLLDRKEGTGITGLQVTALPGDPKRAGQNGPQLVWGVNGRTSLLGGGLTSQILLSPDAPGQGGGSLADRTGLKLGYGVGTDRAKLDLSYVRSGREFAPTAGKSFGLAEQAQRWSLGAQARPSDWLAAEFKLGSARDLGGKGATDNNAVSLRLWGAKRQPAVTVARLADTRTTAAGAATEVTTEKIGVTGTIGATSAFAAHGQRVTTDGPSSGVDQTRQDASLSLTTASKDKKAQAALGFSGGTTETATGIEARQGVTLTVRPGPSLSLSAEARRQVVTPDGKEARETVYQAANAELRPFKDTRLTGSLRINGSGEDATATRDLAAEAKALRYLALAGGYTDRRDTRRRALDTARVRVSLRPSAAWSVTGGLTINPDDGKGNIADATRQEFGLTTRMGLFEIGGGYALTSFAGDAVIPAALGEQYGELSLNLGLRFSRFTRLTGGYKNAFVYGSDDPRGTRSYALGLNHHLGSALNFSLGGAVTEDKSLAGRPADMKAEAKLGVKF